MKAEIVTSVGALLAVVGVALVSVPAALVVAGVALFAFGLLAEL